MSFYDSASDYAEGHSPSWTISLTDRTALAIVAAVAILLRLPTITFAALNYDEAVYALLADGLKHGLLPYVDLVDRKPIGLFLIYLLPRVLLHDGIIGPRLIAAAATVLSCTLLYGFSRRILGAGIGPSLAAGVLFAAFTLLFGGDAAQAPVFFTPLIIAAGYICARQVARLTAGRAPQRAALGVAGLALGVALQIKYSMVFECVAFGCILIACGVMQALALPPAARRAFLRRLGQGLLLMIAGGLAPTIIAGAVYAAASHFDAWLFYNFTVNFGRESSDYSRRDIAERIAQFTICLLPLASLTAWYVWDRRRAPGGAAPWGPEQWTHALLVTWMASAAIGALALRQPYGHYFYGMLAPLSLFAGGGLARAGNAEPLAPSGITRASAGLLAGLLGFAAAAYGFGWHHEIQKNGSPYLPYALAAEIRAVQPQSLYVFNHFGEMYQLTGLPLPTRYPQPGHLTRALEAHSFGFDGHAELARVLRAHPEMVVLMRPFNRTIAPDRITLLERTLVRHYCLWQSAKAGRHTAFVYRRKTGAGDSCARLAAAQQ